MNRTIKALMTLSFATSLTVGLMPEIEPTQAQNTVKFVCNENYDADTGKRLPTTFAWTPRGKVAIVRWETTKFTNYPPEKRCQEVSPRFQEAYNNGTINILTNGIMNNQPVICTAKGYGQGCHTLLFTLLPQDDSNKILENLIALFDEGENLGPIKHNGQNYKKINMQKFLETAPVVEE